MDKIRVIHDLGVCNNTIENFYNRLVRKLVDVCVKDESFTFNQNWGEIEKILENIEQQINESKNISKRFFEEENK